MGKKIDSYFLTLLSAVCYYLYFLHATQKIFLSLVAALFCCIISINTVKRIRNRISTSKCFSRRRYCRQANGIIMELACADAEDASARIKALLEKIFHEKYCLELFQAHPSEKLSQNAVFTRWKAHQGSDKLVISTTCSCDPEVRLMASSLRAPRIAIIDAEQLKRMMSEHPKDFKLPGNQSVRHKKLWKIRLTNQLLNRKNTPRCLLFGFSSIFMYILAGNTIYLFSAMLLFMIGLVALRRAPRITKLF